MSIIPGWGSVTGSHWWSNFYFWASICSLILLGITEVVSHRYSERKDELSAKQQDDTQRHHDEEMARLQHDTALAQKEAAQATLRAAELERKYGWRSVQQEQKDKLLAGLIGHNFLLTLEYSNGDPESFEYANQLFHALKETTLQVTPYDTTPLPPARGVTLISPAQPPSDDFKLLAKALKDADIPFNVGEREFIGTENRSAIRLSIGGRFRPL